jgi:sugar/nucleoside kinase (ribokinase family)
MIQVDRIPGRDEKAVGKIIGRYPGGMVSNFLSAAAAFGAKCGAVVCTGDDEFGRLSLDDLVKRGIDISKSVIRAGQDTFFTFTNLDTSGEKSMTICLTETISPSADEVDMDYVAQAQYVHMIGTYPKLAIPVGREAKRRGVKVSLDIETSSLNMSREEKDETLALSDIVFPNESGLVNYVGYSDIKRGAIEILSKGPQVVVVTKGAKGCEVFTDDEHFAVPAIQVAVKDSTGAGDIFNGAFLACLCKGYPLHRCAKLATAAAAIQIQHFGARGGLATEASASAVAEAEAAAFSGDCT